jgi:hypothetical protein
LQLLVLKPLALKQLREREREREREGEREREREREICALLNPKGLYGSFGLNLPLLPGFS